MKHHNLLTIAAVAAVCAIGLAVPGATAPAKSPDPEGGAAHDAHTDPAGWAGDAAAPGPDLPPVGRSLFDYLVTEPAAGGMIYRVPFPFSALMDRIGARLSHREFSGGTRVVIVPMGRSLQRAAAAPEFFKYPRIVFAATGEPRTDARDAGALLKDRLYVGYVEKTGVLEVISYNEAAGRFEFQLVKDYRAGAQPKVFYANRAICVSCHQNHAPIFSRPIWGETNANGRVAQLLRAQGTDLQLSAQANVDFPDDVDKATARANALVPLQTIWQRGCAEAQDRAQSRRCRAAALAAVLQYGLSGGQGFESAAPQVRNDLVPTLARAWARQWPTGLRVAESSLPDRNPLGGVAASYGVDASAEPSFDWIAASHVPADLDPLEPRPPREIWRFAGALDAERIVAGWAKFFAADDFRALDEHLRQQRADNKGRRSVYRARCTARPDAPGATARALECAGDPGAGQGVYLAAHFDDKGTGRIAWLNLGPAGSVRDVVLTGGVVRSAGSEKVLRAAAMRQGLAARLPDGRLLASVAIRWPAKTPAGGSPKPVAAQFEALVVDDFARVRQAIERMLETQPELFNDGPLVRVSLMRALSSELGMPARAWCCVDDAGMPPALLDVPEVNAAAITMPALQPFFRYCATCHLTHEQFPPNFLSGDGTRVAETLRHCAPRLLVRLSAWRAPADQRIKSPMPPETALRALGTTPQQWAASDELVQLRAYVEAIARSDGQPDVTQLPQGGYEALPACLPPVH